MKAQTYKLASLDIIIVAEQSGISTNGNVLHDITLLAKNPSNDDFTQWNPKIPNYRRLKSNKYRTNSPSVTKEIITDFWESLAEWYYDESSN